MSENLDNHYSKAKAYAYRLISKRLYSEYEISEKLKKREFEPSVIKQILNEFRQRNYVNDLEFARLWIKTRLRLKPKGERLLRLELLKRGVGKDTASQALSEVLKDYSQEELVLNLAQKRIERLSAGGGKDQKSINTRRKIFSFLQRRGFGAEAISKALRQVFKNDRNQ